jgi:putative YphP/YqiW family bacilliredoxin
MPYPELMVKPFRQELTSIGFEELTDAAQVDQWMEGRGEGDTALLVVNSVCGCAAGMARPGVRLALEHATRPKRLATVFAGQDVEATAKVRGYFPDIPPSSPSVALWKDGELVHFIPRHRIEGRQMEELAQDLQAAFDEHCS